MLVVVFVRTFSLIEVSFFIGVLVAVFFIVTLLANVLDPLVLSFWNESLERSFPERESFVVTKELFLDLGRELLALEPLRLLPSLLLFLQDCAELGLPGESPLRLRVPGAGLCLPMNIYVNVNDDSVKLR